MILKIYVKTQEEHPHYKGLVNTMREFNNLIDAEKYYNECLIIDEKSNGFHFTTIELCQTRGHSYN